MKIHYLFCAAFALVIGPTFSTAAALECALSPGSTATVTLTGNRVVRVNGLRSTTLDRRAASVSCGDTDGDGIDELISWSSAGARSITTLRATKRATLGSVCKRIRSLTRGEIWKARASDHIHDQRKLSTSFITLRSTGAPKNNCLYVYDKKGNLIHKLGRYFPTGAAYSSRYYGGHGCGDLRSASTVAGLARSKTGSSEGYVTSGTGNCLKIPNLGICYNSSGC